MAELQVTLLGSGVGQATAEATFITKKEEISTEAKAVGHGLRTHIQRGQDRASHPCKVSLLRG